jgi:hypothetical protein
MIIEKFNTVPISSKIVAIIGLFYVAISVLMATVPEFFLNRVDLNSAMGLYTSAVIDLIFSSVFFWAARSSPSKVFFNFLGTILLLGGIFYLLLPVAFWSKYIDWWMVENLALMRVACALAGAPFGAWIIYLTISSPEPEENQAANEAST